ncbi:MAG: hypothetical protein SGJ19_13725 [Planctomycetia bacterium]|nr:hypothetical protein [Planctomycetia bacterium]
MRLTLRTMLAYMDGVLSPADAEELRRKIEQNEGAAGIMHRVRDVQCRLRLGAPKVEGRGLGGDANTVAEYLDNTLPTDRIPEFERICLESDAHLAESAACHHILALVLGESAQVEPDLRRKLYGLIDAPQQPPEPAPPVAAPPVAEPEVLAPLSKTRRKMNVPEYLRDKPGSRTLLKVAIGLAAALLLAAVAVMAIGPERLLSQLRGTGANPQVAQGDGDDAKDAVTVADKDEVQSPATDEEVVDTDETVTDDESSTTSNDEEPATDDTARTVKSPALKPVAAETATDEAVTADAPSPPTPDADTTDNAPDDTAEADATPTEDGADADSSGSDAAPAAPVASEVGRCFLQKDVLLRFATDAGIWKRLVQGDAVFAGDRLLAFPRFSPAVTLSNGVAVEMSGATQVVVEGPDSDGTPALRILYGRMILMPLSDPQSPVRLLIGDQERVVTFPDTKSMLAVEVRPELVNGSDPEQTPARLNIEFCLVSGKLGWQGAAAEAPAELASPLLWTTDPAAPVAGGDVPKWIRDKSKTGESIAAPAIEEGIATDRPVIVSLKEAANHRQRELRSLAAKCLALIGEYDDFVAILSDPAQWPAWDGQIEELRASMARSPEDAAKVRVALEKARSSDAQGLYRLLWGYTEEEFVKGGAAQELLADLEHQDIDYRVLAHWNLRQLTGMRHPYDPREEDGKSRKDRVELWQKKVAQMLKDKEGA